MKPRTRSGLEFVGRRGGANREGGCQGSWRNPTFTQGNIPKEEEKTMGLGSMCPDVGAKVIAWSYYTSAFSIGSSIASFEVNCRIDHLATASFHSSPKRKYSQIDSDSAVVVTKYIHTFKFMTRSSASLT